MSLLPPTTSDIERRLESLGERYSLGSAYQDLWNPWLCPEPLLIYLAWALSVDEWNDSWAESVKRNVCASSIDIHRMKGTTKSMQDSIDTLGHNAEIKYRYDDPEIPKGKFRIRIKANDVPITDALYQEMLRVVNSSKRGTLHLDGFSVSSSSRLESQKVIASVIGERISTKPIGISSISTSGELSVGAAVNVVESISIREN